MKLNYGTFEIDISSRVYRVVSENKTYLIKQFFSEIDLVPDKKKKGF